MGIDYAANYGIGYKVCPSHEICDLIEDEFNGFFDEYLEELNSSKYDFFEVGDDRYSGEGNDYFVYIKSPLKDGLDLTKAKKELDEELKRLKIDADSDFKEIGGLLVY